MLAAAVLLLPIAGAVVCLVAPGRRAVEVAQAAALVATFAAAVGLAGQIVAAGPQHAWGRLLYADALSALIVLLGAFVAALCGFYSIGLFRNEVERGRLSERQVRAYHALTLLFVSAMLLTPLAHSLGLMWAAIEATTLASTVLIAFETRATSLEAAWKYVIIGSFGVALALFGTILTYYSAVDVLGSARPDGLDWSVLLSHAGELDGRAMRLAFVLALVGYGTKAGLVPMHTWKPDAYSEAPIPAATLLAAGVLNCALYGLVRFHILAARALGPAFSSRLLVAFGLASMVLAALFIVGQRNLRRLLAYSSIDHAGIIVTAIGLGGSLGAIGAMLHMTYHSVTKPLLFFTAGAVEQRFGTANLSGIKGGLLQAMPATGLLLMGAVLAVTASPPFAIFQSEYTVLTAAVTDGRVWVAALFLASTVTVFAGFLQKTTHLVLGPGTEGRERLAGGSAPAGRVPGGWSLAAMALAALPALGFAFWMPGPLARLVMEAAALIEAAGLIGGGP